MVSVSVLLPSYNHEKYIGETIESVLNQTFSDFEFIIIGDCSPDNSVEIIKKYVDKDDRIKFYIHDKNMGIAKTENELIDLAKGKYIAFLNSDDVWHESKLEKQLNLLEKDENLIIWTEGEIIDENSNLVGKKFTKTYGSRKKKLNGDIFNALLHGNYILFASLMFKRDNLKGLRFIEDLKIINDYPFELALAKKYKYHFIKQPLTYYRMHGKNTIIMNKENSFLFYKDIIIVQRYLLETYNKEIPKLLKWQKNYEVAKVYFKFNKVKQARYFIFKALFAKPFVLLNYWYLIKSLNLYSGFIEKILNQIDRIFNFLEQIYLKKVLSLVIE